MNGTWYLPQFYKVKRKLTEFLKKDAGLHGIEKRVSINLLETFNENEDELAINDIIEGYLNAQIIGSMIVLIDRVEDLSSLQKDNIKEALKKDLEGCRDTLSKNYNKLLVLSRDIRGIVKSEDHVIEHL